MNNFVGLHLKRNRGWPWPEESWGLSPMYGDDGWCRGCGMPLREQVGSLVLQAKGLTKADGAWVPNWQFDAVCLVESLAAQIVAGFAVTLFAVEWRGSSHPPNVQQIVVPSTTDPWFDEQALTDVLTEVHGTAGARCGTCHRWRWMPLASESLPKPNIRTDWERFDIIASPEWFGDGWKSFREILLKRRLAELIVSASPKDFAIREI